MSQKLRYSVLRIWQSEGFRLTCIVLNYLYSSEFGWFVHRKKLHDRRKRNYRHECLFDEHIAIVLCMKGVMDIKYAKIVANVIRLSLPHGVKGVMIDTRKVDIGFSTM